MALVGNDLELGMVGGGGVEFFGVLDRDDGVLVAVHQQDRCAGFVDGVERTGVGGIEPGDFGGAGNDGGVVGLAEKRAGEGQQRVPEMGNFIGEAGEGGDRHDRGDALVDGGVLDGGGGAQGHPVNADAVAAEPVLLQVIRELHQVAGFDDAKGDVFAGGFAVAAEIDEDGAIASLVEGVVGVTEPRVFGKEPVNDQDGATRRGVAVRLAHPGGERRGGRADGDAQVAVGRMFDGSERAGELLAELVGGSDHAAGEEAVAASGEREEAGSENHFRAMAHGRPPIDGWP